MSDGNPLGAIQVTGDGVATILLADRGTTGGYTKIATVIGADIGTLAQAVPGHSITYKSVGVEEAHRALRRQEAVLSGIPQIPAEPSPPSLTVLVDGEAFEALDEDGETVVADRSRRRLYAHHEPTGAGQRRRPQLRVRG